MYYKDWFRLKLVSVTANYQKKRVVNQREPCKPVLNCWKWPTHVETFTLLDSSSVSNCSTGVFLILAFSHSWSINRALIEYILRQVLKRQVTRNTWAPPLIHVSIFLNKDVKSENNSMYYYMHVVLVIWKLYSSTRVGTLPTDKVAKEWPVPLNNNKRFYGIFVKYEP